MHRETTDPRPYPVVVSELTGIPAHDTEATELRRQLLAEARDALLGSMAVGLGSVELLPVEIA